MMKFVKYIPAITQLILLACSPLHAADDILRMPKNKSAEQMINPPLIPMNKKELTIGFLQGCALPFIGITLLTLPKERHWIPNYMSFRNDFKATASQLGPQEWLPTKKTEKLSDTYIQIRKALRLNDLLKTNQLIDEYNNKIRRLTGYEQFDIRLKHNQQYHYHAKQISQRLGIAIGSSISTCAILFAFSKVPKPTTIRYQECICSCYEDSLD